MRRNLYLLKFSLIALLAIGGGNIAWADTVIVDGSTIADGWNNGGAPSKSCTQCSVNGIAFYTTTEGQLTAQGNYSWHSLHSTTKINITAGQKVVLKLKGLTSFAKYEFSYSTDNSTFNCVKNTIGSTNDFVEYEIENIVGEYYLYLWTYGINIQSVIIKDATANTPILSITQPDSGNSFGYVTVNTTKTYTVQNIGVSSMNVTISSSDAAFTVSPNSLTDITNDGTGKTFDVTFNYNASSSIQNSATITVTPSYEGGFAQSFTVTAGPDVVLNEDAATTWTTGQEKTVYVKYTANNGWNTISLPITPNGYKNELFGSGTVKAYAFSSYDNNGTLTFETASYMGAGTPYLVYVENASSTPFVISSIIVGYTSGGKATKNGATFQGTFAPITAGNFTSSMYGVTSSGQVRPGDGVNANIKGYRAYFTGISAPSNGARPTIVLEDDGTTTDLGFVKMLDEDAKDVYTLSGQRVQKAGKGLYIVNGRKVVLK